MREVEYVEVGKESVSECRVGERREMSCGSVSV